MANLSTLLSAQSNLVTDQDLAAVATTGSYTDLTNKPTIFSGSYTDLTNKPSIIDTASIKQNETSVSVNQTIASGSNGQSLGPITVNTGIAVAVATGQYWNIY